MAEPEGMKYRATRDIPAPGNTAAYAYRAGDLVHASAVDGADAWLAEGADVEPWEGPQPPPPPEEAKPPARGKGATAAGRA